MALRLSYDYRTLRGDVSSAVASAVVVLPWALAVGVASGLGPLAGLYGTIAIGFFAAVFGGTRAQLSDTSAPMLVAMTVILMQHADNPAEAFTIVMLAGLMQIAMGALRLGPLHRLHAVFRDRGVDVGHRRSRHGQPDPAMLGIAADTAGVWADPLAHVDADAAAVGAVTLAVCVFWPARADRFVSAYLAALVVGTVVAVVWFADAPALGDFPSGLPALHPPVLSPGFLAEAFQPAFLLALIGSINSLMSSLLHDSLTGERHDSNRELAGQGLGNVAAGVLGAPPGSASAVATVFNIRAGACTRVSGALRSVILLALVLGAGTIAEPIPLAVLAGVVMKIGWDIIDRRFLTRVHRIRRDFAAVMLAHLRAHDLRRPAHRGRRRFHHLGAGAGAGRKDGGDGQRGVRAAPGRGISRRDRQRRPVLRPGRSARTAGRFLGRVLPRADLDGENGHPRSRNRDSRLLQNYAYG